MRNTVSNVCIILVSSKMKVQERLHAKLCHSQTDTHRVSIISVPKISSTFLQKILFWSVFIISFHEIILLLILSWIDLFSVLLHLPLFDCPSEKYTECYTEWQCWYYVRANNRILCLHISCSLWFITVNLSAVKYENVQCIYIQQMLDVNIISAFMKWPEYTTL